MRALGKVWNICDFFFFFLVVTQSAVCPNVNEEAAKNITQPVAIVSDIQQITQ